MEKQKGNWFARLVVGNWVTPQLDLFHGWELYSKSFPKAGLMQNGVLYHAPRWVESISESVFSSSQFLLPTPTAQEPGWKNLQPVNKDGTPPQSPNQRWYDKATGRLLQKGLTQVLNYLPTPTASDATTGAIFGQNDTLKLTKNGTWRRHIQTGNNCSLGLGRYVQMLPIPKAQDGIRPGVESCKQGQAVHLSTAQQLTLTTKEMIPNRKLSPEFVEVMQGFPPNWTEVEPRIT